MERRHQLGLEASHTGPHGIGQKSPDFSAIPLSAKHHRTGTDSYHRLVSAQERKNQYMTTENSPLKGPQPPLCYHQSQERSC
jgi:hypothetical protein